MTPNKVNLPTPAPPGYRSNVLDKAPGRLTSRHRIDCRGTTVDPLCRTPYFFTSSGDPMKSRKPIHQGRIFAAVLLFAASVATTATAIAGEVKLTHVHGMSFSADGARLMIPSPRRPGNIRRRQMEESTRANP